LELLELVPPAICRRSRTANRIFVSFCNASLAKSRSV
jgi:hypothetical protein